MYSTIKPKPCKTCGSKWHTPMFHNERKAIAVRKPLQRAKAIWCTNCDRGGHVRLQCNRRIHKSYQHGTYYRKWIATRKKWIKENPADFGYYNCHYCNVMLDADTLTLDHKIPRSRAPELRYEFSNLVPCCNNCNVAKGSIEHDKYEHYCHGNL